jgi:beta-lactam-binding protein with PASTA domain
MPPSGWRHPLRRHPVLKSRRLHVAAAVLLAAVAGSVFVAARSPAVRVPDLRGERASVALQRLESSGLDVRRRFADDSHARQGTVLAQRPAPGTQAEDGRAVTLTVATGRTDLAADDVLGEPYDEAARDLVELGLVPSRVYRSQADGAGTVVAVHPTGRMRLGSEVTLIVAVPGG